MTPQLSRRQSLRALAWGSLLLGPLRSDGGTVDDAQVMQRLLPSAEKLGVPKPGEWREKNKEATQTFDEYVASRPGKKSVNLSRIYVSELGTIAPAHREVIEWTYAYLEAFFSTPVIRHRALSVREVPEEARRETAEGAGPRFLANYILEKMMLPERPRDALAYLAFTSADLWAYELNFVFGLGSPILRTGVWSMARNGKPEGTDADRVQFLRRTILTASHETMHLLGMLHCADYRCVLNGINTLTESDRTPLRPCPLCERKLSWNLQETPSGRYRSLADFCHRRGLKADAHDFEKARHALEG
jgi:archaemetzincin